MTNQPKYAEQLLWVLLCNCKTIEFAVNELNNELPANYQHKGDFIRLMRAVDAFMNVFQKRITKQQHELFKDIVFENVGIISEAVIIMSQIPPDQIDWVSEQFVNIAQQAVKREIDAKQGN
jgi:hypothetical protein